MLGTTRILLAGVGGQGVLTAGRVIGEAVMAAGLPVRVGQLHGMSQRGGSVEATVVAGPGETAFVGQGSCDVLLALEPLEALRAAPRLREGATVWLCTARIVPATLGAADKPYPPLAEIEQALRARGAVVHRLDAAALAAQAGDPKAISAVMVGVLAGADCLPVPAELFEHKVAEISPARSRTATVQACRLGMAAARQTGRQEPVRA